MPRTSKTAAGRRAFTSNNSYINPPMMGESIPVDNTNGTAAAVTHNKSASGLSGSKQPKSVLEKIIYTIRQHPQTAKGVSRSAISKYLKHEMQYDNPNAIKSALKKGVDKGTLEQNGHSFRVAGDPIVEVEEEGPQLEIADTRIGSGDLEAQTGDSLTMKYKGQLEDGYVFDSGSITFSLGAGDVIKGWDQGLGGMKIGGKRKLVVPPRLGYGKRGCAPDIPGNATLHFKVTLTDIQRHDD